VSWLDSIRGMFSFLSTGSRRETVVAEYLIREHHRGRSLSDILQDPYVENRSTPEEINRILDRPDVIQALGQDTVDARR
jgi:hypothetical protein